MAEIERPSDDVLVVHLSPYHSLDLVRVPSSRKYRIVFAERFGVQRRAFVEVSYDQAREIAMFLGVSREVIAAIADPSPYDTTVVEPPLPPPATSRTRTRGP